MIVLLYTKVAHICYICKQETLFFMKKQPRSIVLRG